MSEIRNRALGAKNVENVQQQCATHTHTHMVIQTHMLNHHFPHVSAYPWRARWHICQVSLKLFSTKRSLSLESVKMREKKTQPYMKLNMKIASKFFRNRPTINSEIRYSNCKSFVIISNIHFTLFIFFHV